MINWMLEGDVVCLADDMMKWLWTLGVDRYGGGGGGAGRDGTDRWYIERKIRDAGDQHQVNRHADELRHWVSGPRFATVQALPWPHSGPLRLVLLTA